jgi:hypothetical protein
MKGLAIAVIRAPCRAGYKKGDIFVVIELIVFIFAARITGPRNGVDEAG